MGQLILTRQDDQAIMIGDDIKIGVSAPPGVKARLHIDAPRTVPVHRREVYERLRDGEPATAKGAKGGGRP